MNILLWALSRCWALHIDYAKRGYAVLARHAKGEKLSAEEIAAAKLPARDDQGDGYTVQDGVAIIPVVGIIAKRMADVNGFCMPQGTSVEAVKRDIAAALEDQSVRALVLEIDSPGGTVDGVADLSQFIYESRGQKPITAYANGLMASAAYYIGSAADRIVASQDAEIGSIGVYAILEDDSEAYKAEGIRFEMIKAGKFKGEGHPLFPITQEARALTQEAVDAYYSQFVGAVARNRGMPLADALAVGNGKTEIGAKAVMLKLADEIGTLDTAKRNALARVPSSRFSVQSESSSEWPRGRLVQVERSLAMGDTKKDPEANASGNVVRIDSLTFGEFKVAAPKLYETVREEVLREESARADAIAAAIKATGLDAAAQGALHVACKGLGIEAANAEIARTAQIEASLAAAKVAGLTDEDLTALRADVKGLPMATAQQLVKSFTDAVKGSQARVVKTPDPAVTGKDAEKKAASEKIAEAVATARADFKNVNVMGVTEAAFVEQVLDMSGLNPSVDDLKAAAPDLFK